MQGRKYYSVRMRAAKDGSHEQGGNHISGGELLSTFSDINYAVNSLLKKGLTHSRGRPDFMQIQFECINEPIKLVHPLKIETNEVESAEKGQALARKLLQQLGIPRKSIEKAYKLITENSGMRGAILFDIHLGERIDDRNEKGVRVSRMDWLDADFEKWADHFEVPRSPKVKEALVLAGKASNHPATIAELCWSDDPDYITGYVASKKLGYQRITKLKEFGDERGCRIFFVDCLEALDSYIHYLEKQPVFIQWEE
ncbi:6-carboxyhexanoate--CoA ligase (plasmid) [Pseudalkalibacillus hwajinpoensis]|uniref:6-carboxyhexanoate--CoA ligase n=1 Tax=Guptibacillus hwajinpoensis TaxID=208199 RepID=UPI00325B64D2